MRLEQGGQRPIRRKECGFNTVAIENLLPAILSLLGFQVLAADRGAIEIAAPVDKNPRSGIITVNQVVTPLIGSENPSAYQFLFGASERCLREFFLREIHPPARRARVE